MTALRIRWPRNPGLHDALVAWAESATALLDDLVAAGEVVPEYVPGEPDWAALVRAYAASFTDLPAFVRVTAALATDPHIGNEVQLGGAEALAREWLLGVLGPGPRPTADPERVEREAYFLEDAFGPARYETLRLPPRGATAW